MAALINASTTGLGGLISTGDSSGVLALQTAGNTALTISSAQVATFANAPVMSGSSITGLPLTTGVTGTLPTANGGTGQTTAGAAFNALSPITTTGDLILGNGTNSATRLGIGTNGYVLTVSGGTAVWAAAYPGAGIAVSTGSAWTTSKATPTGVIVGDTDTQTLTNKTLTAPTIASANLTTALTLNGAAGTNGQVLTSAGSGLPSWATVSAGFTLGTPIASTSGTSIDFTSIPSGTKQIVVSFSQVRTNGTASKLIQLGDSGGIENTGYLGQSSDFSGSAVDVSSASNGLPLNLKGTSKQLCGSVILTLENATSFRWSASGALGDGDSNGQCLVSGIKALSATLDRIRITTTNGTDVFNLGEINIAYI